MEHSQGDIGESSMRDPLYSGADSKHFQAQIIQPIESVAQFIFLNTNQLQKTNQENFIE